MLRPNSDNPYSINNLKRGFQDAVGLKGKAYRGVVDNYEAVPMDVDNEARMGGFEADHDSKSASPVAFEEDLDDADVEELMLRKQLLLSALNQCDEDDDLDPKAFEDATVPSLAQEEDDEEENALRAALLGSLRTDVEEADLKSSLMGSSLDSDLRAALLGSANAKTVTPEPSKPLVVQEETVTEVIATKAAAVQPDKIVIRSTKVNMSLQEIAACSKYAPRVAPFIIPLHCSDDSESDSEPAAVKTIEPVVKRAKIETVTKPSTSIAANSKNLGILKRMIAVKQADVARAEQLVDHFKQKLKNAEKVLELNKQQLKLYRGQEAVMLDSLKNQPSAKQIESISVRVSPDLSVQRPPSVVSPKPPSVFYAHGDWLNFDEFLPALHLSTLNALRRSDSPTSDSINNDASENSSISLRWLLLTNEKAPSLDFLRTLLFTNNFHAISCPYDLSGECQDRKCPYEHSKMGVDWILIRLASLCPQALGLTEKEFHDKQVVKMRIQNVLSKFSAKNETDLVHHVWLLVRSALLKEFSAKNGVVVNLARRISTATSNDVESLSILSDQDVNQVVSSLSSSISVNKKKLDRATIRLRIKTLCQILKCRPDFSVQMALLACFGEFTAVSEQLEVADFLLETPSILTDSTSFCLLACSIFKLSLAFVSNSSTSVEIMTPEQEKSLTEEDLIYWQMVQIHATCFQNVPSEFLTAIFDRRKCLFSSNFWSDQSSIDQNQGQVEKLLTSCVSTAQTLSRKTVNADQMKVIFSVLSLALSYRLWKSMREPLSNLLDHSSKNRKICEKFHAKLCGDFPRFACALTLLAAHLFAHFLSPQQAADFLENSPAVSNSVRTYPSVIYVDTLLRLSIEENRPVSLPNDSEIAMIARNFDPSDGCGAIGVSEHFFLSLLRVFCSDRACESFRAFTKSIFSSSLIEKLLVTLSFAVRSLLADKPVDEKFATAIVSPYFAANQAVPSSQKQRIQLMAHSLCTQTAVDQASKLELIERALDSTCLSNDFLLDRLIDLIVVNRKSKSSPDLTYLAGLACRMSVEMQLQPKKAMRGFLTLPCQDATVRLINLLSCPNASNSSPQTRAVVIHSAFRLVSCSLLHHPYDMRLWKLLFTCQRSLSSKFDPIRMYCRLLSQLGLAAPV